MEQFLSIIFFDSRLDPARRSLARLEGKRTAARDDEARPRRSVRLASLLRP
jgi:hypothetical protein